MIFPFAPIIRTYSTLTNKGNNVLAIYDVHVCIHPKKLSGDHVRRVKNHVTSRYMYMHSHVGFFVGECPKM